MGKEPVAPGSGEAESARDARKPGFESRAGGIREDQGEVEAFRAEASGHRPGFFATGKGEDAVETGVMKPETSEFFVGEEGDVGLRKTLTQTLESGRGHDGVAEPIDAAHEDTGRDAGVQSSEFKVQSLNPESEVQSLKSREQSPESKSPPIIFCRRCI